MDQMVIGIVIRQALAARASAGGADDDDAVEEPDASGAVVMRSM
ncbi:hypothetical protein HBDW_15560 [Herbaspirillum sp. DW155]|nr:hypothetical protein HBDW_15560 [Herbaspirillum sp. DW155]